jgi:hypothetical protein
MIFVSSDVASLLHRWEVAEYISEGFVIVGCGGELVADFCTGLSRKARRHIGTWSTIVLILALSVGLKCLIKTNELSGSVIGSLGDKAKEAGQKANTATTNSGIALTKSGKALDEASGAEMTAGKAQTIAGTVEVKAEKLDRQLGATQKDLGTDKAQLAAAEAAEKQEEQTLINMAVCLAPRVIPVWYIGKGNTIKESSVDPLRPYANRSVAIEFVPDPEARRAADSLASALRAAGWSTQINIFQREGLSDGVEVEPYVIPTSIPFPKWTQAQEDGEVESEKLAGVLIHFLHSFNWQARRGWPPSDLHGHIINDPDLLPPGGLIIAIGLYPAVSYLPPPAEKDWSDAVARLNKEQDDAFKRRQEWLSRAYEDATKGMTPKQQAQFDAMRKANEVETDRSMGPYREEYEPQPCGRWDEFKPPPIP